MMNDSLMSRLDSRTLARTEAKSKEVRFAQLGGGTYNPRTLVAAKSAHVSSAPKTIAVQVWVFRV